MVSAAACATLRVTALRAEGLKNVQKLLDQDPFVELELLPWGSTAKTKAASGVNPTWKDSHRRVMELPYPGLPVPPEQAVMLIRVMDAEVTRAARLIGETQISLTKYMKRADEPIELELSLEDAKGKPAGTLFLQFEVVLTGTVEVTAMEAHNLRNVQRYLEQDPYVRCMLMTADDLAGNAQETKVASGVNPVWTKKHKPTMSFAYSGEAQTRLRVEVWDKEYTRKDRVIGVSAVDITSRLINFRRSPEETSIITLDLASPETFLPAGRIMLELRFINDAWDEDAAVVRGLGRSLTSMQSMRKVGEKDFLSHFVRGIASFMEGELEYTAPEELLLMAKKFKVPALAMASGFWGVIVASCAIVLVVGGPKILSLLVGVLYPAYMSFKAIESVEKDDDTQWLTYWCVFGLFTVVEETALRVVLMFSLLNRILFFFFKIGFLMWLQSPSARGALYLYRVHVGPYLRRKEPEVDRVIKKSKKAARELDEKLRVDSPADDTDESVELAG